jgi:hypothetical protein
MREGAIDAFESCFLKVFQFSLIFKIKGNWDIIVTNIINTAKRVRLKLENYNFYQNTHFICSLRLLQINFILLGVGRILVIADELIL